MNQGFLVVIDGNDGSGKKTQTQLLKQKLKNQNYNVKTLDFPQYNSFFGKMIKSYLNGEYGNLEGMPSEFPALLYALDRFTQKNKINKWLKENNIVILDRYVESNMAFQGAKFENEQKKNEFTEWLYQLEYKILKLPHPDLTFFLHVPTEYSQRLIENRPQKNYINNGKKDIHESNKDYQKKVEKNYLKLAREYNWEVIECIQEDKLLKKEKILQKIHQKVIDKVNKS